VNEGIEIVIEDRSGMDLEPRALARLAEQALERLDFKSGELGVSLVSAREMELLNRQHLGRIGLTDVLSFPLDVCAGDETGEVPLLLGDVIICPEVAGRQAREHVSTLTHELCLLLIHGILHIAGYDHETDAGEMDKLQDELLEELCIDAAP
jgi:probable rRNA maturation factor